MTSSPENITNLYALHADESRHNFPALEIVRSCRRDIPNVRSVTYFDTSFHSTIPKHVRTYPINQEVARVNGLRKYGFHGISYSFILRSVAKFLNKPVEKTNLITLHLGSGASICAIKDGKSIDTSYASSCSKFCEGRRWLLTDTVGWALRPCQDYQARREAGPSIHRE